MCSKVTRNENSGEKGTERIGKNEKDPAMPRADLLGEIF